MKKFILAFATGVCAISAHAEDPKSINFNVQLQGDVPSQHFFEVAPDVSLDQALSIPVPDNWDGKETGPVNQLVSFNVKSSYGPVRVRYSHNLATSGNHYQVHLVHEEDPSSYIRIRPLAKIGSKPGANNYFPGSSQEVEIAGDAAAKGTTFNYAAQLFTGGSDIIKPGVHSGLFTFVFEVKADS